MLTGLNIGALEAKLDKTYESDRPVELLAYAMEVSRQADDDAIKALVDERMPGSSYRRVWVYEHMLGKATCHYRSAHGRRSAVESSEREHGPIQGSLRSGRKGEGWIGR
jgi:hypothetical protein